MDAVPKPQEEGPLASGLAVRAFYHAGDHPTGYRYVRLVDGSPEESPERGGLILGLSTGWIPATVAEDWPCPDGRVLVRLHGRFADAYIRDPVDGMYWRVPRTHIRLMGPRAASDAAPGPGLPDNKAPQPQAELSLLVVRWWDYWNPKNNKSVCHNVANAEMLKRVLEGPGSPHAAFGELGAYQVHTAFVRESADLRQIGPAAAAMRANCRSALYFLWPTTRPASERRVPGTVAEPELFALMRSMEDAGIRTCWPHPSGLYRQLAGKLWVAQASRDHPELRVPPTVMVDWTRWEADPHTFAEEAIEELSRLRAEVRGERKPPSGHYRGVVKLGFSWMGEDVRPFAGQKGLVEALQKLLEGVERGAPCLIQERVEGVACELRLVSCRDRAGGPEAVTWELVRMRQKPARGDDESFSLASHHSMDAVEAAKECFKGNMAALKVAEGEVKRLGALWLGWFRSSGYGTPGPAFRLDFIVVASGGGPDGKQPQVWTVELCECGGSLCGLSHQTRTAACLNECLALPDGSCAGATAGSFPQPLPPLRVAEEEEAQTPGGTTDKAKPKSPLGVLAAALTRAASRPASSRWPVVLVAVIALLLALLRRRIRGRPRLPAL